MPHRRTTPAGLANPNPTRETARIWVASEPNAASFDMRTVVPLRRTVITCEESNGHALPGVTAGA